jgi:hypothetical protein
MTAGSGRRLWRRWNLSGPLGVFSRTLLESKTWGSTEYLLRWREKATKSGRFLMFQLAPWTPRTAGNGSGLWPTCGKLDSDWSHVTEETAAKHRQIPGKQLCGAHLLWALYPTPEKAMQDGGHKCRSGQRKSELMLGGLVSLYQTPSQHQFSKRRQVGQTSREELLLPGQVKAFGPITSGPLSLTEKFGARLATLSAWLMGYTAAYLAHWATASSGRSPRSSSPRSKPPKQRKEPERD